MRKEDGRMKDIILAFAMLLTFLLGYFIMIKVDAFVAEILEIREKYESDFEDDSEEKERFDKAV